MKTFAFLFTVLMSAFAFANGLSAKRSSSESYEAARDRNLFFKSLNVSSDYREHIQALRRTSAERAKKPLSGLDTTSIPDVGSYADLENQFKYIRDTRFIQSDKPAFPRRPTWLYPDDGCYARAEVSKLQIEKNNFPEPKKMFVFGNLSAKSDNSPEGKVEWWYHVALTYRVGSEVYILDPALNPQAPLKLVEWNKLVGGEKTYAQYSICSENTYDPDFDCYQPTPVNPVSALGEQRQFLSDEWNRLLELNRNPEKELGEFPPWLNN